MITFKSLLGKNNELAVILGRLENPFKKGREEESRPHHYIGLKGNLSLILKHRLEFKLKKLEDLSIPNIEPLVKIISFFKIQDNSLKEKLNRLLDEKFQKNCGFCLLIKLEYKDPYRFSSCDAEILHHYIIAKKRLGKLGGG